MERDALIADLNTALEALSQIRSADVVDVEALTLAVAQVEAARSALAAADALASPAVTPGAAPAARQTLGEVLQERGINRPGTQEISLDLRDVWTGTGGDSGELDIVVPEFDREIDRRPRAALTLAEILPTRPISSDTLVYYKQTGFTNAAAPKARRADGAFVKYAESSIATEKVTVPVVSVGHLVITDEIALEDASELESLVVDEGVYGVWESIESQLLADDDTANGLSSIAKTGTGRAQSHSYQVVEDDSGNIDKSATGLNFLIALREAKTKAEKAKLPADFFVCSPEQMELIDLARNDKGNFYAGGPFANGVNPWGLTPVVSFNLDPDVAAVVGSTRKLSLRIRKGVSIRKGHMNEQFGEDAITLKVSGRFALKNVRPEAFVVITATPADGD